MKKVVAVLFIGLLIYLMITDRVFFYTILFIVCALGVGVLLHGGGSKK